MSGLRSTGTASVKIGSTMVACFPLAQLFHQLRRAGIPCRFIINLILSMYPFNWSLLCAGIFRSAMTFPIASSSTGCSVSSFSLLPDFISHFWELATFWYLLKSTVPTICLFFPWLGCLLLDLCEYLNYFAAPAVACCKFTSTRIYYPL